MSLQCIPAVSKHGDVNVAHDVLPDSIDAVINVCWIDVAFSYTEGELHVWIVLFRHVLPDCFLSDCQCGHSQEQ